MNIDIKRNADEIILSVEGRIDTNTASVLEKTINDETAENNNLVLDMSGVNYISSAGLRVLLSAQKKMQVKGSMKLVNVCESVMEVFEMTGFADILEIQ